MLLVQLQLEIESSTLATQPVVNSSSPLFPCLVARIQLLVGPVVTINWGLATFSITVENVRSSKNERRFYLLTVAFCLTLC